MPWVIGGAIAGSAVLSYMGSQNAADAQKSAADASNAYNFAMYNQSRADLEPWRKAGGQGLDSLMWGMGIGDRSDYRNAMRQRFTTPGGGQTIQGTLVSGGEPMYGPEGGITGYTQATYQYPDGSMGNTPTLNTSGAGSFDREGFRGAMSDFRQQGKFGYLGEGFGEDPFAREDFKFKKEPGYAFRLKEGLKAVEGSAATQGMLHSGRTMKELTKYGQGFASNEMQNAFNKYAWRQGFDSNEYANAFNRFQIEQGNKFNRLGTIAGFGTGATNQLVNQNANSGQMYGANTMAGGNATASGYMGGANAVNSGVNSGLNAYYQNQFLNRFGNQGGGTSSYGQPWYMAGE